LQQSWLWFDGSQGIEPQHCMLCWSSDIADMQSTNGRNRTATTASTKNVVLRTISFNSKKIGRFGRSIGYSFFLWQSWDDCLKAKGNRAKGDFEARAPPKGDCGFYP